MHYYDLRAGRVPLPAPAPGYDPAGDAAHLFPTGLSSPATSPISGLQILDSLGEGHRFVVRIPDDWNGDLIACGTPATRSEFANDAIFGDFALARGYAFASSNKGIPYNATVEAVCVTPDPTLAYPVPFDANGMRELGLVVRFGALWPKAISVRAWHEDLAKLIVAAKAHVRTAKGREPKRTFALGLSNGGGQVRYLLERSPELVDGGVEWAGVYWSAEDNILSYLPRFLQLMPQYVRSGYRDKDVHDAIVASGFPPDRLQEVPGHRSLWDDHYANLVPHYADLTTFLFALLLDPRAESWVGPNPNVPNPVSGARGGGPLNATALALPAARADYVPSPEAKSAIGDFAFSGALERPLVGIAGTADVFITPQHHAAPYLDAVRSAGRADRYRQFLVDGGPHVDAYVAYGYGLRPQLPFAWRAFDLMLAMVEGESLERREDAALISDPSDIR
ncbi:MAG: hypothetical protein GIW95_07770 [Candidatus Eremiobacteraeota bacterium]|nr:hypothetical protein [Candidatus Eremiobacteraeota bacterium]